MKTIDNIIYPEKGDTLEVIKTWDIDDNSWRKSRYKIGYRFTIGSVGQETQLPYYKYPNYFKVVK